MGGEQDLVPKLEDVPTTDDADDRPGSHLGILPVLSRNGHYGAKTVRAPPTTPNVDVRITTVMSSNSLVTGHDMLKFCSLIIWSQYVFWKLCLILFIYSKPVMNRVDNETFKIN